LAEVSILPVSHGSELTEIANELPELPIESGFMPKLKERIALAKEIEKAQHVVKKENHDKNWLKEAAEAMDVDIDPSL
jgi:ATP-dependent RNA helicase DDX24/MAK5